MSGWAANNARARSYGRWTALLLLAAGCSLMDRPGPREPPPKPATIRVHLASDQPQADCREMTDRSGQTVYVSPVVELDNADILEVRVLRSEKRTMLQVVLNRLAARQLQRLTGEHVGARLAILIDDELICALPIYGPETGGQIRLVGQFSDKDAEKLGAALNTPR